MSSRKIPNRPGITTGFFPSLKMNRMIPYEGRLELHELYLLDFDPDVGFIDGQPFTIKFFHDDRVKRYTPDFHIIRANHNVVIECKAEKFLADEKSQLNIAAGKSWCEEHGWDYTVVLDSEINQGFHLKNVLFLTKYSRYRVEPSLKWQLRTLLLSSRHPMSLGELAREMSPENPSQALPLLYATIYHHILWVNTNQEPITEASLVFMEGLVNE